MGRTIETIRAEMIAAKDGYPELSGLNISSPVSRARLWIYVVSVAIWALEQVLEISTTAQTAALQAQKIHSLQWYGSLAKKFQLGYSLPVGEVNYDNTGIDDATIKASQKVKFASATKTAGGLKIKIAGLSGETLSPLLAPEFEAFKAYMARVQAAGDNLSFVNDNADMLMLHLTIFRDPLVIDSDGKRVDGTNDTPVQDAIDNYIKGMDFDHKFIPAKLVDELQKVDGVVVPHIDLVKSKYALFPWVDVPPEGLIPEAGYVRIYDPSHLNINFEVWVS